MESDERAAPLKEVLMIDKMLAILILISGSPCLASHVKLELKGPQAPAADPQGGTCTQSNVAPRPTAMKDLAKQARKVEKLSGQLNPQMTGQEDWRKMLSFFGQVSVLDQALQSAYGGQGRPEKAPETFDMDDLLGSLGEAVQDCAMPPGLGKSLTRVERELSAMKADIEKNNPSFDAWLNALFRRAGDPQAAVGSQGGAGAIQAGSSVAAKKLQKPAGERERGKKTVDAALRATVHAAHKVGLTIKPPPKPLTAPKPKRPAGAGGRPSGEASGGGQDDGDDGPAQDGAAPPERAGAPAPEKSTSLATKIRELFKDGHGYIRARIQALKGQPSKEIKEFDKFAEEMRSEGRTSYVPVKPAGELKDAVAAPKPDGEAAEQGAPASEPAASAPRLSLVEAGGNARKLKTRLEASQGLYQHDGRTYVYQPGTSYAVAKEDGEKDPGVVVFRRVGRGYEIWAKKASQLTAADREPPR